MKKLLVIAILMLALVFTVVACNNDPVTEETTLGDTTVETPTEAPTAEPDETTAEPEETTEEPEETTEEPEETTEEPEVTTEEETTEEVTTADPADPVWMMDAEALAAMANTVTSTVEKTEDGFASFTATGADPWFLLCGNIGEMPKYMAIRYRTNTDKNGEFFISNGANPEGGKSFVFSYNADSEWNLLIFDLSVVAPYMTEATVGHIRYDFFVDIPAEGTFLEVEYIAFFNTAEYAAAYDFEMHKAPMWDADKAVIAHQSFDELDKYANDTKIEGVFTPGQSGGWDKVLTLNDFSVEALRYWGWIAGVTEQGVFGYQINGGAAIYDEAWTHPEDLMAHAPAGSTYTTRMKIMISLEGLDGENTIRALYKDAAGTEVCLNEFTVILPEKPKDITNTFVSDVASNEEGTDLQQSDLANFFTVQYGASEPHKVEGGAYNYGGINEMYTDVNGKYAYSVNMLEAGETAMMFVRGTHVVHSVDVPTAADGLFPINNYYETDGNNHMGGAGVYAAIYGGNLNIFVKVYNDENKTHIALKKYAVPTDATELTIADDGETLYFVAGGKLLATVALSGATTYEKICDVADGVTFATTAVVTLVDGTTETIENTLVVSTCASQIGIALRPNTMKFDSVKVQAFSAIEIPEFETNEPETPDEPTVEYYENLAVPQSDWVISGHMPTILSPENKDAYPNHYPMVAAGGIESGALLYQGSIYLGNLDLSKYSKVIVKWGHDNSEATLAKYNAQDNTRFALVNASKDTGNMSPAEDTIIASATYELKGWGLTALEIDLSEIDYSGDVYLTNDSLEGCFALVYSVEFIGAEIPAAPVEPEA